MKLRAWLRSLPRRLTGSLVEPSASAEYTTELSTRAVFPLAPGLRAKYVEKGIEVESRAARR